MFERKGISKLVIQFYKDIVKILLTFEEKSVIICL